MCFFTRALEMLATGGVRSAHTTGGAGVAVAPGVALAVGTGAGDAAGVISKPSSRIAASAPVVTLRSRNPSGASAAIRSRTLADVALVTDVESTCTPVPLTEAVEIPAVNAVDAPVSVTSTVVPRAPELGLAPVSRAHGRRRRGDEEAVHRARVLRARLHRHVVELDRRRPAATVTFATADVGDCTVSELTVTPGPKPALLAPAAKCVAPPEIRTSSLVPVVPVLGVTERIAGVVGARGHLHGADAGRRLRRAVAAGGGHGDVAEPGRRGGVDGQAGGEPGRRQHAQLGDRDAATGHGERAASRGSRCWSRSARRRAPCRAAPPPA